MDFSTASIAAFTGRHDTGRRQACSNSLRFGSKSCRLLGQGHSTRGISGFVARPRDKKPGYFVAHDGVPGPNWLAFV